MCHFAIARSASQPSSRLKTVVFLKATLIVASSSQIHELCPRIGFTDLHSYFRVKVHFSIYVLIDVDAGRPRNYLLLRPSAALSKF